MNCGMRGTVTSQQRPSHISSNMKSLVSHDDDLHDAEATIKPKLSISSEEDDDSSDLDDDDDDDDDYDKTSKSKSKKSNKKKRG